MKAVDATNTNLDDQSAVYANYQANNLLLSPLGGY